MERRQLNQLMPKDAQDADAARELVSLGPDEIRSVVPEMLRLLKNVDSPVCATFADFFAREGECFADQVASQLSRSTMPEVKWVIVSKILPFWSAEALRPLTGALGMLMTGSEWWGTDLLCIWLLAKHSLVERSRLEEWIKFKQHRLQRLSAMADQVAHEMGVAGGPQSAA
jgi:hypothetical protein